MIKESYIKRQSKRGQRMANARWKRERKARESNPPDLSYEDQVEYAKQLRKGNPIAEHYVIHDGRQRHLLIRWSIRGTVAQWDALIDGKLKLTCGKRRMIEAWPCLSYLQT